MKHSSELKRMLRIRFKASILQCAEIAKRKLFLTVPSGKRTNVSKFATNRVLIAKTGKGKTVNQSRMIRPCLIRLQQERLKNGTHKINCTIWTADHSSR